MPFGQMPPEDRQCKGYISPDHPTKAGERCTRHSVTGEDYCYHHGADGVPPDHRRCVHPYSKNHQKYPGERCRQIVMKGQTLCVAHGGKIKKNIRAAERRTAEANLHEKVTRQLARLDVDPIGNPLTALSQLAGQVVAFKDALADRVNALNEIRYEGGAGEQVRAEITLYERAMDRANTVLGTIARLNIDERLMKIEEKKAAVLMDAIQAGLAAAGLTPEQSTRAKQVIAQRLRSVRAS